MTKSKAKFPLTVHITREEENDGTSYLIVREGGVFDVQINGEPIAIYELVEQGTVEIKKSVRFREREAMSSHESSGETQLLPPLQPNQTHGRETVVCEPPASLWTLAEGGA